MTRLKLVRPAYLHLHLLGRRARHVLWELAVGDCRQRPGGGGSDIIS